MKVKEISFEFGMTQNVGDYTNVRPSVKLVAEIAEDDDLVQVLAQLEDTARTAVHDIVDNELEAAGRTVKYYRGPLHCVYRSELRQCIVIARSGASLPQEKNWKHSDHWTSHIYEGEFPTQMRPPTAQRAATVLQQAHGWEIYDCTDGDFSDIPPLPDAGPEPVWHQKELKYYLSNMRIDEAHWEELAVLDHVSDDYLRDALGRKYNRHPFLRGEELLAFIRENRPFDPEPEPDEDDYDEDDDLDF